MMKPPHLTFGFEIVTDFKFSFKCYFNYMNTMNTKDIHITRMYPCFLLSVQMNKIRYRR